MAEEKRPDPHFIRNIIVVSLIVLIAAFYPIYAYASGVQVISVICGYATSLVNVLLGYMINELAFNKKVKSFMLIVLGGMSVRMFMVMIILILLLTYSNLDTVSLVLSVFFFYFLFIAIEIHALYKKSDSKKIKIHIS